MARLRPSNRAAGVPAEGAEEITPEWKALIAQWREDNLPAMRIIDPFTERVNAVLTEAGALLISKHADYGPKNISLSPGGPLNGLRVRIYDKTARINNLIESGAEPENESLRDSFIDLANYAVIALLVLDGSWPE